MGAEPSYLSDYGGDGDDTTSFFDMYDTEGYEDEYYTNINEPSYLSDYGGDGDDTEAYSPTWQQSVRDFLNIGEAGAKFFAGMAGGKTPPRKPPRTERASSRGREARTSRIEDAKRMTSRQLATLRRPPVEVDFDKLINGNVITKVKGAMEEYIQNPTGPKGTKITLSSAGLGAIRSTKKLT
jgi:hypothetical protein